MGLVLGRYSINHFQSFNLKLDSAQIGKIIKDINSFVLKASLKNLDIPIHHDPGFLSIAMEVGSRLASKSAVYFIERSKSTKKPPIANDRSFLFHDIGEATIKESNMINGPKAVILAF